MARLSFSTHGKVLHFAANGDVWIADGSKTDLLYFPGGRIKDGRIIKVEGLKSPLGIAIDAQNRVWSAIPSRTRSYGFPLTIYPKWNPSALGPVSAASPWTPKGNLWAASNMSLDFPPPVIPDGVSIMEQFKIAAAHMLSVLTSNPKMITGVMSMSAPTVPNPRRQASPAAG